MSTAPTGPPARSTTAAAAAPGRPRNAATDDRIRAAALELLAELGPTAVTMEAVAGRAGVAKTTLYRRHADRTALLTDALQRAIGTPEVPFGVDAHVKVRAVLTQVWHQMSGVLGRGGLAALVRHEDPEFGALFREILEPYDVALAGLLADDVRSGVLRSDLDTDAAVSLFIGAYLGELVRHDRVGPQWLDRCVDLIWHALVAPEQA